MTDTSNEPEQVDFTATIGRLRHARQEADAKVQALIDDERWDNLCPPEPKLCKGETRSLEPGAAGPIGLCPLDESDECPHQNARAKHQKLEMAAVHTKWMQGIGFAPRYQHPDPARIPTHLKRGVDEWLEGHQHHMEAGTTLWLSGKHGCGKTCALAYVARRLLEADAHPNTIRFLHAPILFDRLVRHDDAVTEYGELDVLMIDDLGREHDASWPMARFVSMIEMRYSWERVTMVTSNRTPDELQKDFLWAPVVDRLLHKYIGVWEDAKSQRRSDK